MLEFEAAKCVYILQHACQTGNDVERGPTRSAFGTGRSRSAKRRCTGLSSAADALRMQTDVTRVLSMPQSPGADRDHKPPFAKEVIEFATVLLEQRSEYCSFTYSSEIRSHNASRKPPRRGIEIMSRGHRAIRRRCCCCSETNVHGLIDRTVSWRLMDVGGDVV